jgi:hypothetical protein
MGRCEKFKKHFLGKPCLICKKQGVGHHIKSLGSGGSNELHNGVCLCVDCHQEIHNPVKITGVHGCNNYLFAHRHFIFKRYLANNGWAIIETLDGLKPYYKYIHHKEA